jgi:hypothetical protein
MFFEMPEADETDEELPALPEWSAPPPTQVAGILPLERVVAQSANVAVVLPVIQVFPTGCMIDVEIVIRREGLVSAIATARRSPPSIGLVAARRRRSRRPARR